jgi:hypothetical protein
MRLEEIESLSFEDLLRRIKTLGGLEQVEAHVLRLLLEDLGVVAVTTEDCNGVLRRHREINELILTRMFKGD